MKTYKYCKSGNYAEVLKEHKKVYDTYEGAMMAKASLNGCWPHLTICETGGNDNER